MERQRYCRRLIEVDLPIKRISENARLEKERRRSHVPLLYIWPATRPPSACRAVICASIYPDPVDELCPSDFKNIAKVELTKWSEQYLALLSEESYKDFVRYKSKPELLEDNFELRKALLHFIADFSDPMKYSKTEFLETARKLTMASNEVFGGERNTKPFLVDPFAGGGAIPLEALRIGCDVFSGDLNSVAVFYNKVLLEIMPKYGSELVDEITKWFKCIKKEIKSELKEFYPNDNDGLVPIAYLWARTIKCEGPGCGAQVPLIRSLRLTRKTKALKLVVDKHKKTIDFEIIQNVAKTAIPEGTLRRGSAVCPCCGYTTDTKSVRKQLSRRKGGVDDARLFCVVLTNRVSRGRYFRVPTTKDFETFIKARNRLVELRDKHNDILSLIPNEPLPTPLPGRSGTIGMGLQGYGIRNWGDLFNSRQLLTHLTYIKLSKKYLQLMPEKSEEFKTALCSIVCLVINRLVDLNASLCVWQLNTPNTAHVFGRWALSIVMDFGEINPLAGAGGSIDSVMRRVLSGMKANLNSFQNEGAVHTRKASATNIVLPDDAADYFITDPPYYDAIPYSDLSNFFYVWMKRTIGERFVDLFEDQLTDRLHECIMDNDSNKDKIYFEKSMEKALLEGRRVLKPNGVGVIIFAHKSTSGWESLLQAILNAGWIFTASWPIDTEMQSRLRAKNSATLSSSVHLVCRPKENPDGSLRTDEIGDWRDVLQELPKRIHEWMPRLAKEGVVGADAIFSCLGPALEIFSQYSQVEKANGDRVELQEYLEHVWAAVAKEALNMIFEGAHTEGFEEDSRLTAMWLWTVSTSANGNGKEKDVSTADEDENGSSKAAVSSGFSLEFDAARKIAQGLGAHLEKLSNLIEIKGDKARLLPVSERVKSLFGKDSTAAFTYKRKKKEKQLTLFDELKTVQEEDWSLGDAKAEVGKTVLDRLHQSMILFGAGRGEALRRFLVEEGVGKDERFWQLAQALSALYPSSTDEKRWVDGVLARKKGLGF